MVHKTDDYIHFKEHGRAMEKHRDKMRAAYAILAAVDKKALDYLLEEAERHGGFEEAMNNAGPEI